MCEQTNAGDGWSPMTNRAHCRDCTEPATVDSPFCSEHLADAVEREAARIRKARQRARHRSARLCIDCGKPSPKHKRCRSCHRKRRGVTRGVTTIRADPVSLLRRGTVSEAVTERDGYARQRNRGSGLRGGANQTTAVIDAQELKLARKALDGAMFGLAEWSKPEVQALPRIQKAAARRAYLSLAHLCWRHLAELLRRAGYDLGDDQAGQSDA